MNKKYVAACGLIAVLLAIGVHTAMAKQDKYNSGDPGRARALGL